MSDPLPVPVFNPPGKQSGWQSVCRYTSSWPLAKLSLMRQIRRIVAAVARRPTSLLAGYAFQPRPQQPKIPNERKIKANRALFSGHQRKLTEM
jgi:hypothetical protein